jgi:acyl-CoA synthetase (AMP-forming)/AMP-acid ligase II
MSSEQPHTVPQALSRAAEQFGDAEALVDWSGEQSVRLTYRELRDRVRAVAAFLIAREIQPGDRIAINAPNTYHWVVAALATLHIGAVLVPVNTRLTGPETFEILHRGRVRVLVVADRFLDKDRLSELRTAASEEAKPDESGPVPGLPDLHTVLRVPMEAAEPTPDPGTVEWSAADQFAATDEVDARARAVSPDDISDILFTSGTTGRSKGVLSAHRQVLAVARAWAAHGVLTTSDRYIAINPFSHSFGYKAGILPCLLCGATLVPITTFNIERVLRLTQQERITVLPGPPTIYQSLMDHPERSDYELSSLRLAVTGAATVPIVLVERMGSELGFDTVLTAYGLTEAVVATMCDPDDDAATVASTAGRPTAGFELRIADEKGRPLPSGDTGEVLLRGPNTMLGYLDDPATTSETVDADGWLHTGDVGRVDERGYLTITDRLKDMYVSGGFNVYPAEVEQALARMEGVADCAVVGLPDGRLGEVGKAFIVTHPGSELSTEDVLAFCRNRLANYKVPRHVEFRETLPRNAGGKVLKRRLTSEHQ